ncbi:MAG TPA: winged helix-turn-helix domain-containing protein [Sphingomonas sp.]|nr:winged helix-turn-helix domain-containing protein [Sphingomonas sp.]
MGVSSVDRAGLGTAFAMRGIEAHRIDAIPDLACRAILCGRISSSRDRVVRWRSCWAGPLVVLARDQAQAVALLDAGADDAILDEACDALVAARVAALLRRQTHDPVLRVGGLAIDPVERRVTRNGHAVVLLPREYALLVHLARHAGETVSRHDLLAAVWRLDFDPGTNVVQVHVSRLRAKLDRGFAGQMLVTEKGRGYRLVAD